MRQSALLFLALCASACHRPSPASAIPKFDIHTHVGADGIPRALEIFDANGIEGAVNLSGGSTPQVLAAQLDAAKSASGRVVVFANIDFKDVLRPGWVERQVAWLEEARRMGARGVKVFKTLGLHIRDETGNLVAVDDPRLDPIFDAAGRVGMPVLIHTGDPKAFFDPISEKNERFDELHLNPGWSYADRARFPSWEALFQQFEHRVARSPRTTFIGAHFGNDPEDPARVGAMLDRYPNLFVDTAARVPEIGRTPTEQLRRIFVAHHDRILFGTDIAVSARNLVLGCPEPYPETAETTARFFDAHWRFFESATRGLAHPSPVQGHWTVDGLALPRDVLEDVYHRNAERLLGWSRH